MTDTTPWLTQLRGMIRRQRGDDDPVEQMSLGVQDLLDTVPDYEICEALSVCGRDSADPLTALLSAECERRDLDY